MPASYDSTTISVPPVAQATPSFAELYVSGTHALAWNESDGTKVLLATFSPQRLAEALWAGMSAAKDAYGAVLSKGTIKLIDRMYTLAQERLRRIVPLWTALVRYEESGEWDGSGLRLDEAYDFAEAGAGIGRAIDHPVWGMLAGLAVAAVRSLAQQTSEVERAWQSFRGSLAWWYQTVLHDLDTIVLPRVRRDDAARRRGPLAKVARVALPILALGAAAYGGWRVIQSGHLSAATPSEPMAASSAPPPSPFAPLVGTWTSEAGVIYDAVAAGESLELRILEPKALAKQGYVRGETHFTLRTTPDGSFEVEVKVHPSLPAWLAYADGGPAECNEVWAAVKGQPLRARAEGGQLRIDGVKIDVAPADVALASGRVVRCKQLDPNRASKMLIVLTRGP
jgi:hypothetical protein